MFPVVLMEASRGPAEWLDDFSRARHRGLDSLTLSSALSTGLSHWLTRFSKILNSNNKMYFLKCHRGCGCSSDNRVFA